MSFAYFDNILTLLSEELQVPLPKLKEAWTNSFLKFYKADASILKKTTAKKSAAPATKAPAEPKSKKTNDKLPPCDEPGCTIFVKNQRPIQGKVFCSKHYKKAINALKKLETAPATKAPTPSVSSPAEDLEDEKKEEDLEAELEPEAELDEQDFDEEESEEEENPEELREALKKGLNTFFSKTITEDNYDKVGTLSQYLAYFEKNWRAIQILHPNVIDYADVVKGVNARSIKKKHLYHLLTELPAELKQSS